MEKLVFLGESFTTLLYVTHSKHYEGSLIIDLWKGGSLLHGWELTLFDELKCLDRVPILCKETKLLEDLGGELVGVEANVNFIGTEEGYRSKMSLGDEVNIQHDWLLEYSNDKYYAKGGWCSIYRELRNKVSALRIYGELQRILPEDEALIIKGARITYRKVLNTLPLPYILSKLAGSNLSEYAKVFKYVPLYAVTLIAKETLDNLKLTYVGKKGFLLSAVVELPVYYLSSRGKEYKIIYGFAPVAISRLRAELFQKVVAELKKLKIIESYSTVVAERCYFERYGLLGTIDYYNIKYVSTELRKHGIYLDGRLGSWSEKSVQDILVSIRSGLLL